MSSAHRSLYKSKHLLIKRKNTKKKTLNEARYEVATYKEKNNKKL